MQIACGPTNQEVYVYDTNHQRAGLALFAATGMLVVVFLCYSLGYATLARSATSAVAAKSPTSSAKSAALRDTTAVVHSRSRASLRHSLRAAVRPLQPRAAAPVPSQPSGATHVAVSNDVVDEVGVLGVRPTPLAQAALSIAASGQVNELVSLIHQYFPKRAWKQALVVAYCESRFHANSIGYDSNGTHDRGYFQFNDGGTEQMLLKMTNQDPLNLNLAFNPSWNIRAAAVLYVRDGWSQWSCGRGL